MDPKATRSKSVHAETDVRVTGVVVVTSDAVSASLDLCLRSVLADPWVDELVLVDAGAPPAIASTLRALKADRRDVTLLRVPVEVGIAEARNRAVAQAQGRWLLFVQPNVALQRGAVARMVAAGRSAASPWIVGGRVLDAKGRERLDARGPLPTIGNSFAAALGWRRKTPAAGALPTLVPAVGGQMMMTPRADFVALGGFEGADLEPAEAFDLCRRAVDAGGQVRFAPRAEGVEFQAQTRAGAAAAGKAARGLSRYLARAARSRRERAAVAVAAPVIGALMVLRGIVEGLVRRR
ncbi:MAG: glycosyltransferase [Alphaproteobacteria bacterium]|nr:glycosyltransferase [Alphaproteobacteria bacterium]